MHLASNTAPNAARIDSSAALDLYFNLLKRSLTNTIFGTEPDASKDDVRFLHGFTENYINGPAVSMLPLVRLDSLQTNIIDVLERGVPGDLIEAGAWRGGTTIFMHAVLKALGDNERTVWVADSFEGLPEPDAEKYPAEAKAYHGPVMKKAFKRLSASLEEVQRNFQAYGMLDDKVKFLKGWFKDTLPTAPIKSLAILRVDGDFYESTRDSLVNLYDKLSPGGYAIVDDYGEDMWTYCRKAVDEFREERGISAPLVRVDARCVYWQKAS